VKGSDNVFCLHSATFTDNELLETFVSVDEHTQHQATRPLAPTPLS